MSSVNNFNLTGAEPGELSYNQPKHVSINLSHPDSLPNITNVLRALRDSIEEWYLWLTHKLRKILIVLSVMKSSNTIFSRTKEEKHQSGLFICSSGNSTIRLIRIFGRNTMLRFVYEAEMSSGYRWYIHCFWYELCLVWANEPMSQWANEILKHCKFFDGAEWRKLWHSTQVL